MSCVRLCSSADARLTSQLRRHSDSAKTLRQKDGKSAAVAALDVLLGLRHSGVCHFSSAEVFKALKRSYVPAARCLFKMIRRFIFSWQWVHCSHLPVNFKAFLVGGGYISHQWVFQHGQLRHLSIILNGWLIDPSVLCP